MKKIISLTLFCALFLALMCGCSDKDKQTENTEPDATATEPATEPSTGTPNEPPTEPTTEAPTEPEGLQLNMDLLNDIGLTYDQLTEKYGDVTACTRPHGGFGYRFENNAHTHIFSDTDVFEESNLKTPYRKLYIMDPNKINLDNLYHDEQGDYIPIPKEGIQCLSIEGINAKHVFINPPDMISIFDIQNIEGITDFSIDIDEICEIYCTSFKYNGISIGLCHIDNETIDLTLYKDSDKVGYRENGSATLRKPRIKQK